LSADELISTPIKGGDVACKNENAEPSFSFSMGRLGAIYINYIKS
jgi:hypothetical protein